MTIFPDVERFWLQYLASLPAGEPRPQQYTAWYFGDGAGLADSLGKLVVEGVKTATASLHWMYVAENEPLPQPGDLSVITDFAGSPLCIIQTTRIDIVPFDQVSKEHAFLEGEDDRSLEAWREGHWRYFSRECEQIGRQPALDMPIICERFTVVYRG